MASNTIVGGQWKDVRLLERLNERLRRPITRRELLERGVKGAAALIAANYLVNKSKADDPPQSNGITYDVDNSMTCELINQIITDANGGDKDPDDPLRRDTIHFQAGQYNLRILGPSRWEYYNFFPNVGFSQN